MAKSRRIDPDEFVQNLTDEQLIYLQENAPELLSQEDVPYSDESAMEGIQRLSGRDKERETTIQRPQAPQASNVGGLLTSALSNSAGSSSASTAAPEILSVARGPAGTSPAQTSLQAANATTAGQLAGYGTAAYNSIDALKNIASGSRRGKGAVEGVGTLAGTTLGAVFGGPIGAGVGSIAGRTVGRGLASAGESLGVIGGKSDDDYRKERWGGAVQNAASDTDAQGAAYFGELAQKASESDAIFDEGPLKGRKWNWEEVKNLGRGEDVWGAVGFFEAFPDWLSGFSEQERSIIAQAALDNDLLTPDNGGLVFSGKHGDLQTIQNIAAQVKEGTYQPPLTDEERDAQRAAFAESIGVEFDPNRQTLEGGGKVEPGNPEQQAQGAAPAPITNAQKPQHHSQGGNRRPAVQVPETPPAPVLPPPGPPEPPQPSIRTPSDYANAYLQVYNQNTQPYTNRSY